MFRTQYELINTNNPNSYGNNCIGVVSTFHFDGELFYFDEMRSSKVSSISVYSDLMLVQTKNTLYTFKKQD